MRKKALSREGREILVINWFQIRIQRDNDSWATSYEIAKGQGISASSKFRKILNDMVVNGALEVIGIEKKGRMAGRGYRLKRGTFQRVPLQPRTVIIKSANGVEQLEMC